MLAPVSSHSTADEPRHTHAAPPALSATARRVAIGLVVLVLFAIGGGILARVTHEKKAAAQRERSVAAQIALASAPPDVPVVAPETFGYDPHFSITGTLDPVQQADLSFSVSARLLAVNVALGEHVEAGQVLAVLDRKSISAQSSMASAAAQANQANVALAQDRVARAQALNARGATSDQELAAATQGLALAQAQLAQAQAQTRLASADGSNHILKAPFAGTITKVPSGIGGVVAPGEALFRIEDLSSLVLRSGITEQALDRVLVGDAVTLETHRGRGVVRAFARSLDPITRRAPIEITVGNDDGRLVGHALVKGSILSNRPIPSLRVPGTAVRADQSVLVVGADGKIGTRRVMAIIETDGHGIVLAGLTPADRVVVRPSPELTDGRLVHATAAQATR